MSFKEYCSWLQFQASLLFILFGSVRMMHCILECVNYRKSSQIIFAIWYICTLYNTCYSVLLSLAYCTIKKKVITFDETLQRQNFICETV